MTLRLYNTLTKAKEDFVPLDAANVRMYVCGPTVYDLAHIGNARPVIVFDLLFRLLRHLYGPEHVTYARNITDVDDKIIARAAEEGVSIEALTRRTEAQFHADVAALGCLPPTFEPRATQHIGQMIAMIEALIAKGHAYAADGHVLFDVGSFADYGRLARRSTDEMVAGARVEVAPYKRDPMDFVLWKPSVPDQPGWASPWGRGRPGWHIECSAMAEALLGTTFDIHGGGIDLVFPHHENEIAQSRSAHDSSFMAKVWMHNGFVTVEGDKMAKSTGNFVTVRELLDGWHGRQWHGEVIRLAMLKTHYRQPINWTAEALEEATTTIERWYKAARGVGDGPLAPHYYDERVLGALNDDLNTPEAITRLNELYSEVRGPASGQANIELQAKLKASARLMGLLAMPTVEFLGRQVRRIRVSRRQVDQLVHARREARAKRDFAEADRIRDELAEMGVQLKDGKDPETGEPVTTWEVAR